MENSPFTTIGDEPVEARIVAWVLGEASAFEVAELERLCEERPELLVFRRRMRALHGLLTEAESAQPDEGWKLPPEKRRVLDEIFGEEKTKSSDPVIEKRIRFSARRALLAIAACLVLTVIIAGLTAPAVIRQRKRADMPASRGMIVDQREWNGRVPLSTRLPGELIEGTPKPINVPNLEDPVQGPAGSSSWSSDRSRLAERRNEPSGDQQSESLAYLQKRNPNQPARPSLAAEDPRSNASRVMAEGAESNLPELEGLAAVDSKKSIDGVSEFQSKNRTAARAGGSGKGYGLQASAAPSPAAAPASPAPVITEEVRYKMDLSDADVKSVAKPQAAEQVAASKYFAGNTSNLEYKQEVPVAGDAKPDAPAAVGGMGGGGGFTDGGASSGGGYAFRGTDLETMPSAGRRISVHPAEVSLGVVAGEKLSLADKKKEAAGKVPVLGERFTAAKDRIEMDESTAVNSLDTANAPAGLVGTATAVTGGTLGFSSGFAAKQLESQLQVSPPAEAGRMSDAMLRSAPALTDEQTANVDKVRRSLYVAEGSYNLGKYDDAKREYEAALRTDPYNAAARRGLERIASEKTDNYRAAYDHTRSELFAQVENAWELSVPADGEKGVKESDDIANIGSPIEGKPAEGLKTDPFGVTSNATKPTGEVEYEIHTGYSSEYLFRGRDLSDKTEEPPKPDLAKLMEEIAATEDPYSTFSLNISDASFQVAQAALAKGERPDPAGIKVEQFYNAVDYGDPAPAAGEPVAVNIEQSAHPVIPGRNLVRVALKTAAAGRSAAQPLRLTLLVDQSGSMVREDRRAAMDKALAGLAGLLTEKDLVTVVGFSRTPRLLSDGLQGDKAGKLAELVNQSASEGGTNLEEAIKLAGQMAESHKLAAAQNRIVLLTDGAANLGNADPAKLAENVKQLRQKGIAFDIAGIAAEGLNDELLGELARNGNGRYYVVGKGGDDSFAKQLAGAFRPAAENVKVQVHFNPERVGRYKLIGFEKDRLKTEDFRNDAVDAAELAAEEAGIAVYQIEPLPGGKGELGEVSVRFRDAASAQMVERTWTIPHDSGAPAFDRATPSMQLAVLSMLAAEKLKGGPLGEAIDFKQLADPRANVKRFYGNAGRVGEVLNMVDALK